MWSAACRDFERDIIPMCISEGMGIAPWGALGGGTFKTEEQRKSSEGRKTQTTENQIKVSKVLEKLATEKNTAITSIALAYVMHKTPYVFPIVGGRKIDHLKGNIEALNVELSSEDIAEIEGAVPFDIGFPLSIIGQDAEGSFLNKVGGHVKYVTEAKVCSNQHRKKTHV